MRNSIWMNLSILLISPFWTATGHTQSQTLGQTQNRAQNQPQIQAQQQAPIQFSTTLNQLKSVDLRDLATFNTELAGTANLLMRQMLTNPKRFGIAANVAFYPLGPQGPLGHYNDVNGVEVFSVADGRTQTLKNSILRTHIEDIVEEVAGKTYKMKLILFVHNDQAPANLTSNGYYFHRITVRVDWNIEKDPTAVDPEAKRLRVLSMDQDIPLSATNFHVLGDLLARKVILEDTTNSITIVYPISVGSIDARTGPGMDGTVSLMTPEFPNGYFKKVSLFNTGSDGYNTRSRLQPAYYMGRPFFGILQVRDDKQVYDSVGMHFQIDMPLVRGFISHGCIRVRDMDLYILDAILNEGPSDTVSVHVVKHLDGYEAIDHPMPKVDQWYNSVVYSQLDSPTKLPCPPGEGKGPYLVSPRFKGDIVPYGTYHTVEDSYCMDSVEKVNVPTVGVISYLLGQTMDKPQALLTNAQHITMSDAGTVSAAAPEGGAAYEQAVLKVRRCLLFVCSTTDQVISSRAGATVAEQISDLDQKIARISADWWKKCDRTKPRLFRPSKAVCDNWAYSAIALQKQRDALAAQPVAPQPDPQQGQ